MRFAVFFLILHQACLADEVQAQERQVIKEDRAAGVDGARTQKQRQKLDAARERIEKQGGFKVDNKALKEGAEEAALEALAAPFVKALAEPFDLTPEDNVQVRQLMAHYTEQFEPYLKGELNFIRQTCEIAPEKRSRVKQAGEHALQSAVRSLAKLQSRGEQSSLNIRATIRKSLLEALEEVMSPDGIKKYVQADELRRSNRKKAAIKSVIAQMDEPLRLTSIQRQRIGDAISGSWNEDWEQWLKYSGYHYLPNIQYELIAPHLTPDQKPVWNGLQKASMHFHDEEGIVDDDWWGKPADKPLKQ